MLYVFQKNLGSDLCACQWFESKQQVKNRDKKILKILLYSCIFDF